MTDSTKYPRFYNHFIESLKNNHCFYFIGGRGMGKTRFLEDAREYVESLQPAKGSTPTARSAAQDAGEKQKKNWISVRNPRALLDIIEYARGVSLGSIENPPHLYVDGLDDVFESASPEVLREAGSWTGEQLLDQIEQGTRKEGVFFIATGSRNSTDMIELLKPRSTPHRPSQTVGFWSLFDSKIHIAILDPWRTQGGITWQERIVDHYKRRFAEGPASAVWRSWAEISAELSGGYPDLVAATIDELDILKDAVSETAAGAPDSFVRRVIRGELSAKDLRLYIEDVLWRNGLRRIERTVREDVGASHWANLIDKVAGIENHRVPLTELTSRERSFLHERSLVFRDADGHFRIPSPLVLDLFKSEAEQRGKQGARVTTSAAADVLAAGTVLKIRAVEGPGSPSGVVEFVRDDGEIGEANLKGRDWAIVDALRGHPGTVPLEAIQKKGGFASDATVRSALSRLRRTLEREGVRPFVVNERGAGYRLDLPVEGAT